MFWIRFIKKNTVSFQFNFKNTLDIQMKLRWCEFNNKLPQTANRGSFLELDKEKNKQRQNT